MARRKESLENEWLKKVGAGTAEVLEKGSMICQACNNRVLVEPDKKDKIICPYCKNVCRGIKKDNEELV